MFHQSLMKRELNPRSIARPSRGFYLVSDWRPGVVRSIRSAFYSMVMTAPGLAFQCVQDGAWLALGVSVVVRVTVATWRAVGNVVARVETPPHD